MVMILGCIVVSSIFVTMVILFGMVYDLLV